MTDDFTELYDSITSHEELGFKVYPNVSAQKLISDNFASIVGFINNKDGRKIETVLLDILELFNDSIDIAKDQSANVVFNSYCTSWRLQKIIDMCISYYNEIIGVMKYCDEFDIGRTKLQAITMELQCIYRYCIELHYVHKFDNQSILELLTALFDLNYQVVDSTNNKWVKTLMVQIIGTILEYSKLTIDLLSFMKSQIEGHCDYSDLLSHLLKLNENLKKNCDNLEAAEFRIMLKIFNEALELIKVRSGICDTNMNNHPTKKESELQYLPRPTKARPNIKPKFYKRFYRKLQIKYFHRIVH